MENRINLKQPLLFILCLAFIFLSAADNSAEFLKINSPSFETIDAKTNRPKGWWWPNAKAVVLTDSSAASDGKQSLKVVFNGSVEDVWLYTTFKTPLDEKAVYKVTADVRTREFHGYYGLGVYRSPAPYSNKIRTEVKPDKVEKTDWQPIELEFKAKKGMKSIQLYFFTRATWGELWLDNFKVSKVEGK
ncbi:MAG: hypothetical protein ACYTFY_17305 [Planctomycetota bacterium]|jgi:hypothetical protein